MTDSGNYSDAGPGAGRAPATSVTLLARVRAGDAGGWRRFVCLYTPLVLWWCRRNGLRDEDAQDVTQEVFQTVAAKVGGFAGGGQAGAFRRWLSAITRHKLGDHYRRRRRQPRAAGGSDARALLAQAPADPPDDSGATEDGASERGILCRAALDLVRPEFQPHTWEAAWRLTVEGHSAKDVAAELGMSVGAVYTAKSRVLSRLRAELEGLLP
jgi:RNA polymerase sigma-70 factor (ECF subfamily)